MSLDNNESSSERPIENQQIIEHLRQLIEQQRQFIEQQQKPTKHWWQKLFKKFLAFLVEKGRNERLIVLRQQLFELNLAYIDKWKWNYSKMSAFAHGLPDKLEGLTLEQQLECRIRALGYLSLLDT